jgi:hypothetical protein
MPSQPYEIVNRLLNKIIFALAEKYSLLAKWIPGDQMEKASSSGLKSAIS